MSAEPKNYAQYVKQLKTSNASIKNKRCIQVLLMFGELVKSIYS